MEKIHSGNDVKVIRRVNVVNLALGVHLLLHIGESFCDESKILTGRDFLTMSISLVGLQCNLEVVFAYRYYGINWHGKFASSLPYSFMFPNFVIAT